LAEAHLQIKGLVRLQYRGLVRLQYGGIVQYREVPERLRAALGCSIEVCLVRLQYGALVQYREVPERLRAARTSAAAYRFSQSFAHMRVSLTKLTN
jgi:hypothetical protein